MKTATLLADPSASKLTYIRSAADSITIVVKTILPYGSCPLCNRRSTLVHSRYLRRIADLPWQGVSVKLELHTRRFRCGNALCHRRIFCERLPQVADRFHILKNLSEALERLLTRQHQFVRAAVQPPAASSQPLPLAQSEAELPTLSQPAFLPPLRPRPGVAERRDNSLALYNEVVRLKSEGLSTEEIAPRGGKRPRTVRHWLQLGKFQELRKHRRSRLDAYLPYISARWEEGCHNVSEMWRELVARGYRGSYKSLNNYLHRKPAPPPTAGSRGGKSIQIRPDPPLMPAPGPRRAAWMLLKPEGLKEAETQVVKNLCRLSPEVAQANELARRFFQLARGRQAERLSAWMTEVEGSQLPELKAFARGLEQDRAAIEAALREEWSNGQTEGQVHRLKLLKRQMYGRAKFDLLRAKVLFAA